MSHVGAFAYIEEDTPSCGPVEILKLHEGSVLLIQDPEARAAEQAVIALTSKQATALVEKLTLLLTSEV